MKIILVLSFCFFSTALAQQYDDNFARNVMWPLAAGAYIDNQQECITSATGDGKLKRKIDYDCDILDEKCSAYTASSDSKKAIIVAWRGSQINAEVPMEVLDILFGKQRVFPGGAKVADFFYDAFLNLWNSGIKDDFLTLRQQYPDYEIWITGHSLGAAMAGLCAGYLAELGLVPVNQMKLMTFGEPRTGDKAYAALIDSLPYSYRIVHNHDPVPHVPLNIENYEHHRTEIYYSNTMANGKPFTVCVGDESHKCSEGVPILLTNVLDHLDYYGEDVVGYFERGCVYKK
ncbi:unnamed protein product, partial [Mesorhabditis belari]|uniref:Fungal lipase-like domain-containing protein n=1 Tax=Mesorhabditis belari TaxID=2138241 RepID=A0AAF3ECC8_9BILA